MYMPRALCIYLLHARALIIIRGSRARHLADVEWILDDNDDTLNCDTPILAKRQFLLTFFRCEMVLIKEHT